MATYQLKMVTKSGNAVQNINLTQGKNVVKVQAQHTLVLTEQATAKAPKSIQAKRKGKDLIVKLDEETSIELVDYFATEDVRLVGEQDGGLYYYDAGSHTHVTAIADLIDGEMVVQQLGSAFSVTDSSTKLASLGMLAVGAVGIMAGSSGSDSVKQTTENKPTNQAPTAITLDNLLVDENASGAVIGKLTTTDTDAGDTHTYTVNDERFEVVDGQLKLKAGVSLDYEAVQKIDVEVTATDSKGLSVKQAFAITVNNINEAPTAIILDNLIVDENVAGAVIGKFTTTDVDVGDTHTYEVNDERFEVVNGQLKLKDGVSLDYETVQKLMLKLRRQIVKDWLLSRSLVLM